MMGAIAFQKDLGAVHSCAHALGTVVDMHHGLANGVMIDHVMRFNLPAATDKMAELARVCGATRIRARPVRATSSPGLPNSRLPLNIPATLTPLGVKPEHLPKLVDVAIADGCHVTNPRPCMRADFDALFRAAL